jgi:dTDP-4-amino-4,6-dideoxygalactose transaminase
LAVARRHNLKVVEDCAQANGATYHGREVGSFGDVGCYSLQFNKIITCGEGGMVVTDDEEVWARADMFHDAGANSARRHPREQWFWGINFRMPEVLGAIALVQLRKLDSLLEAMRVRKQMLKSALAPLIAAKGLQWRHEHDAAGDAAIALVFFMPNEQQTADVVAALRAENIGAGRLWETGGSDMHVYAAWTPVMQQRNWGSRGGPWAWAQRKIEYSPDMCERSLGLLSRGVHLNVSPLLTNEDVEETIEGVTRVLNALA